MVCYLPCNNLQGKFPFQLYNLEEEYQKMGCGVAMCVLQNREMLNLHKDSKSHVSTLQPQNQNIRVNISSSALPNKKECVVETAKTEEKKEDKSIPSVGKENTAEVGKQNTLVVQVKQKEVVKPEVKESQKVNESKPEVREVNDRFNKFQKQKAAQPEKKDVLKPKQPQQPETKVPEKKQKTPIKTTRIQQSKQKDIKQTPKQTVKQAPKQTAKQAPKQTVKQAPKQPVKQIPKQTVKQAPKQTVKQASKQTVKQAPKWPVKEEKVQKVQTVQKQQVKTGKRQSMNIEDLKGIDAVVNGKKAEETTVPGMDKKASSKNLYKNDISRKSLKVKKEMTPVDSLFLQSVITRQEEPVIESDIKESKPTPRNQSRIETKPENTRNIPPSRKGKNEPIQIVENLMEIDKNLDIQKVPKKTSQQAIITKQKIVPAKKEGTASKLEEKTIKKISESRKVQDEEKRVQDLKKKAQEENRKAEQQKRLLEAKKKIQLQEKKALEMQTSKLKKVYNV